MYKLRLRENRGKTITENLNSFHTFSFAQYFDPFNMGFSDLRVINDDILKPEGGLDFHSHANMEIISIVLDGELSHKDTSGGSEILKPGDVQVMSAGSGITHSEVNPSFTNYSRFFQIWILPNKKNLNPAYSTKYFPKNQMENKMKLIVSGNGKDGSLKIHQDAEIYRCFINLDITVSYDIPPNRKLWIQVANGAIDINSNILESGDGMSIVDERGYLDITGVDRESDFLLFNLRNLTL